MTPILTIEGRAAPLGLDNLDTDQLCAARFMKRRRHEGYGDALLHDLRFTEAGAAKANPIDAAAGAPILLAGRNFGGGSSREAAVYAVLDAGFRAVLASSFGDIFAANAARNGLVPAVVAPDALAAFLDLARSAPQTPFRLDLAARTVSAGPHVAEFAIDDARRTMLMNGWDDSDVTRQYRDAIAAFVEEDAVRRPWAKPAP
ncbi:3-isopropylmalate dehydratase small subunit [Acuticoccus kandeliae]|uniref:3-isopropylmalate dehydratase small subunit n=1 Tax=Acuticoccus kandeliae TaxID=2073160 RepID=UPI000D3E45AF|nr:3-isopropylmalate dehydratase small subunit [Acuticoccus kandeliae]